MKKLLLISFLFISFLSYSQEWYPVGAKWTYGWATRWWVGYIYEKNVFESYTVQSDTTVLGINCKKIVNDSLPADYSFRYTSGDSVFFLEKGDAEWKLLYDFSVQAGDTIFYSQFPSFIIYGNDTIPYGFNVVGSTGQIIVNNDTLRTYTCSEYHSGGGLSEQGEFAPFAIEFISGGDVFRYWPWWISSPFVFATGLRCYSDSIIGFYKSPNFNLECDTIYSVIIGFEDQQNKKKVKIYPIPSSRIVNIQIDNSSIQNSQFRIYDVQGKLKLQETIQSDRQSINLDEFQSGIYFYELELSGQIFRDKIIIEK